MSEPRQWMSEVRQVLAFGREAHQVALELEEWLRENVVASDVLPRELPPDCSTLLRQLHERLVKIERAASAAFQRYSAEPASKALLGRSLSEEEFLIVEAMKVETDQKL